MLHLEKWTARVDFSFVEHQSVTRPMFKSSRKALKSTRRSTCISNIEWRPSISSGKKDFPTAMRTLPKAKENPVSPLPLDNGTAVSFRKAVEDAIGKLPNNTVTNQIEDRIIRLESSQ